MHRRLLLGLVPVILAGSATLALPASVLAANGYTDTGTTTYVINTAKSEIDVTVTETIKNTTPAKTVYVVCTPWGATCPETEDYYYSDTYIWVPAQAVSVKASSDAGKVSQSVYKTDAYGRELKLGYTAIYYGQTRTVKLTYALPGAPRASGDYRALKAYAEVCGSGTGLDSGSVNFVVPDGFDVTFSGATAVNLSSDTNGLQTYSTGKIASADGFWTCMEGTRPDVLTNTSVTTADQAFNLQAWPEDSKWAASVGAEIQSDVPALEALTGLKMPGGSIDVQEVGNWQLGEYAGTYSATTKTASITEGTDPSTVAHELSHIWFNPNLLDDPWMYEGLAVYSEQAAGAGNFKPCTDPGAFPGTGTPALGTWKYLDNNSTAVDENVATWQYAASCYLITTVADAIGPDKFKAVLAAASKGEIAYLGNGPAETWVLGGTSISSRNLLDLIDERGMLPAGVTDLDQTQTLFAKYGLFTADLLSARSQARSDYHALAATAATWKMPLAVRTAMAEWDFAGAEIGLDSVKQILALRDQIAKNLPGFNPDGTALQTAFESAATQKDLDSVLDLAKQVATAATKVDQAKQADAGSRNVLQSIGLLGVDLSGPLAQANTDLKNAKPADATASAQKVIDSINSAGNQGLLRIALLLVLIVVLVGITLLAMLLLRRRRARVATEPDGGLSIAGPLDAGIVPPSAATDAVAPAADEPAAPAPSDQPE